MGKQGRKGLWPGSYRRVGGDIWEEHWKQGGCKAVSGSLKRASPIREAGPGKRTFQDKPAGTRTLSRMAGQRCPRRGSPCVQPPASNLPILLLCPPAERLMS